MSDPTAPDSGEPTPPYTPPSSPPPPPGAGLNQPYPGAQTPPPQPPYAPWQQQGYPAPAQTWQQPAPPTGPVGNRPIVLAIIALALAVVGLVMAFIPFVTFFSGLFLLAGFVMGLVALISKKQGGKGFSIAAIAVAVVGWIVSFVVTIATIGIIGQAAQEAIDDSVTDFSTSQPDESDVPDAASDAIDLTVVETAFGREQYDPTTWWYVVIVENPNDDFVYDIASVDVEATGADGTILDTSSNYVTALSGRTAISGSFISVGQGEISSLNVLLPAASEAITSPLDETGTFVIDPITATTDDFATTATGTISGSFDTDQELVGIIVVARGADGSIIGGATTYVDRLPADGSRVQFEALFLSPLPAEATYEAYATL